MTAKRTAGGPAVKRGAPPGNKNAIGNLGNWYPRGNFVTRHLMSKLLGSSGYSDAQRTKLVHKLTQRLFDRAIAGDLQAIKEICNRMEGRPRRTPNRNS
jgi:uncharacterized protein YjcR